MQRIPYAKLAQQLKFWPPAVHRNDSKSAPQTLVKVVGTIEPIVQSAQRWNQSLGRLTRPFANPTPRVVPLLIWREISDDVFGQCGSVFQPSHITGEPNNNPVAVVVERGPLKYTYHSLRFAWTATRREHPLVAQHLYYARRRPRDFQAT